MSTIDALKQARGNLERTEFIIDDTENCDPLVSAAITQAAALIAIAERLDTQNEHLSDIRCHLDDILAVLQKATVPGGAFKVFR